MGRNHYGYVTYLSQPQCRSIFPLVILIVNHWFLASICLLKPIADMSGSAVVRKCTLANSKEPLTYILRQEI